LYNNESTCIQISGSRYVVDSEFQTLYLVVPAASSTILSLLCLTSTPMFVDDGVVGMLSTIRKRKIIIIIIIVIYNSASDHI
jgi:hypothetical protein